MIAKSRITSGRRTRKNSGLFARSRTHKWEENQKELRALREEQNHKWEENQKELRALREEQNHKWEENQKELRALREEQNLKWEENQEELRALREEQNLKWEENQEELRALREEQNHKWDDNQAVIRSMLGELRRVDRRIDSTIGALGARWGLSSEQSFRGALKAILEETFGVTVERFLKKDQTGQVFGRPDQVEIDVVVRNGEVLLVELKSSMSSGDMYIFDRKVLFFENETGRKASRKIVVSPMLEERALGVAKELGIETYSAAEDVRAQDLPQTI